MLRNNQKNVDVLIKIALKMGMAWCLFHFRYTIKGITNHPFFQEDSGVKVDLVEAEPGVDVDYTKPAGTVKLLLQLEDPKKRKDKHKENEGIQFDFNLGTDQPEKVTQELVSNHFAYPSELFNYSC